MYTIIKMYVTLMPAIFAGIINMVWCKLPIFSDINRPIDNYKILKDERRLFGDNKTWKGFFGYLIFGVISSIIWGFVCNSFDINDYNYYYTFYGNTIAFNIITGLLTGFFYALFELPNSFLKRRLGIEEGKTAKGLKKFFFIFLDQADSVFGCCLVVCLFYKMPFAFYLLYVLIGSLTHIACNVLLYLMKLRKNMF